MSTFLLANWSADELIFEDDQLNERIYLATESSWLTFKTKIVSELDKKSCSPDKACLILDLLRILEPVCAVEIGVHKGTTALIIANGLKELKKGTLFAVDTWSNRELTKYLPNTHPAKKNLAKANSRKSFWKFKNNLTKLKLTRYCKPVRMKTKDFAQKCENIDFLHLNGDFSEKGSLEEVLYMLPKVASGGCILVSRAYTMIEGKQSKGKALMEIADHCEMVASTDNDNTILFQKI